MIPILTRAQMRAYDAHAIERCHVPGVVLMENAGAGAAEIVAEHADGGSVVIVCGSGNNGGDGFVVARHLMAHGVAVETFLLGARDRVAGDARLNLDALLGLGATVTVLDEQLDALDAPLGRATVAVDAIFGTGLTRAVAGRFADAIAKLNDSDCVVVALDVPSGVDADSGAILGVAIQADITVTFAHLKAGLVQGPGVGLAGDIEVVDLGIFDAAILDEIGYLASAIDADDVADTLGERAHDHHKYRGGSILVVAGSRGKTGAAVLAARAALRSGAGLVTIASWPDATDAIELKVPEVMTHRLDASALDATLRAALDRRDAVALGPGLGLGETARALTDAVLRYPGPVVIDADAITHLAGRIAELRDAPGPRILTPHAGELGRLLGISSAEVEADRIGAAMSAQEQSGATVVLKGPGTVVASAEGVEICLAGNPALATAGSGDVLTGITAALVAHAPAHEAACAAAHLHAVAADRWRETVGSDRGMLASDLIDLIPSVIAAIRPR